MKILGAFIALALAVPFVGTSAPANDNGVFENALFQQSIEVYESHSGIDVDVNDIQVLASQQFDLPLGATGVLANFNTVTGVLEVEPISALPDTSGESGCLVASFGFGYHVSPVGVDNGGGCAFFNFHPGGVETMTLACVNSQYCYDVASGNGFVQMFCQFNTVTVATSTPAGSQPSSLGNGICQAFAFNFGPPPNLWPQYYGYTGVFPPAPTLGLTNW